MTAERDMPAHVGTAPSCCADMIVKARMAVHRRTVMAMPAVWPLIIAMLAPLPAAGGPPDDADGAQRHSWPGAGDCHDCS